MIKISHQARVAVQETIPSSLSGGPAVPLSSGVDYMSNNEVYYNVWSRQLDLTGGLQENFDTSALPFATAPARDLYAGQEIRLCAVHHAAGDGFTMIRFFNVADEMAYIGLNSGGFYHKHDPAGHLFAGPIDRIEMMPLTGDAQIHIVLATQQALA